MPVSDNSSVAGITANDRGKAIVEILFSSPEGLRLKEIATGEEDACAVERIGLTAHGLTIVIDRVVSIGSRGILCLVLTAPLLWAVERAGRWTGRFLLIL